MSHYARIENDQVVEVIVAEQDFVATLSGEWVQTSYNTQAGVHLLGGTPLRKNYAGIGYTYNRELDAFVPPKPYASWILDPATALWSAPTLPPNDNNIYTWNENTVSWVEVPFTGNV